MKRGIAGFVIAVSCLGAPLAHGSDSTNSSKTGSSPTERKLPGGGVLRSARGTHMKLGKPIKVQLDSRGDRTPAQVVGLTSGRVEMDLPQTKNPSSAVLVQAPFKVSAVAKAGRSVVITSGKQVSVGAISGEMLVATGNDWRVLPAGSVREFVNGVATGDHQVLKAPATSLSAPILLSVSGEHTSVVARAAAVPHAASYEFSLFRLRGAERQLLKRVEGKDGQAKLEDLEPGSYGVSAHAIEASGLEGAESEVIPLRVVKAELPEGAKLTEGGILLPPSQRVRLRGTEGVQVSYGKVADFVALPDDIGLIRGQPTLVRLRAAGSSSELSLRLAPRAVQADIRIGPARARWPQDTVTVSVRLSDARGRPLGDDVQVKPIAYVNVTPVKVEWKREHNVLTAVIPQSLEPGPWVVRVEISDDTGAIAGRDFLEIAPTPVARK
ncbi:MAG: hypothetical protein ACOY0T_15415 [Myxococcota bacterium]